MPTPLELRSTKALMSLRCSTSLFERLAQLPALEQGPAPGDLPARRDPRVVEEHSLLRLEGSGEVARDSVHAVPNLVVERVRSNDRVALRKSFLETLVHQGELTPRAVVSDRDEAEGPEPLEVGRRMLGDVDGAFRCGQALVVLQLKRVDACDADVHQCQIGGRSLVLERCTRMLELLHGGLRLVELPLTTTEVDSSLGRLDRIAEVAELPDGLDEELLGGGRLAVVPAKAAHPGEEQRALVRIGEMRENVFEGLRSLPGRDRALSIVSRPKTSAGGFVRPSGVQKMARDGHGAPTPALERVGGTGMDPLALRQDRVARNRLLRQGMPPAVALICRCVLLQELLTDCLLQSGEDGALLRFGDVDEQSVLERAPEHGRGPQHLDVNRVEPADAGQHRPAPGTRE